MMCCENFVLCGSIFIRISQSKMLLKTKGKKEGKTAYKILQSRKYKKKNKISIIQFMFEFDWIFSTRIPSAIQTKKIKTNLIATTVLIENR